MKKVGIVIGLALLFAAVLGVAAPGHASPPRLDPFSFNLKPTIPPQSAGPVDMEFSYTPLISSVAGSLFVTVTTENGLEYFGEETWAIQADTGKPYSTILHISIPPNDTSSIRVTVHRGDPRRGPGETFAYFVTTGETVEVWGGNPRYSHPSPPPRKSNDPILDTMTTEQLETEYEICLDLRDSAHLRIAEEILGRIPESSKYKGHDGYYILWISLENIFKLGYEGIDIEFTTPPPWSRRYRPPKDSVSQPLPQDSAKPQGALDSRHNPNSPNGLSLDHVTGLLSTDELLADQELTFHLRLNNNTSNYIIGHTLGFRVYSPDGAEWGQEDCIP